VILKALLFIVDDDIGSELARKFHIVRRHCRQYAGAFGLRQLDSEMTNPADPPGIKIDCPSLSRPCLNKPCQAVRPARGIAAA
jgi:hypothetical protein